MPIHAPQDSCSTCALGAAADREGLFCPLISSQRRRGEILYREGEPAAYAWFIREGEVAVRRSGSRSRRAICGPGSFVGLEALVTDHYQATARALADVTLCGAPRSALESWLGPAETPALIALKSLLRSGAAR